MVVVTVSSVGPRLSPTSLPGYFPRFFEWWRVVFCTRCMVSCFVLVEPEDDSLIVSVALR